MTPPHLTPVPPPPIPPAVAAAFAALPAEAQDQLRALRALIFAAADETGATPLDETLKWGQPAYLPPKRIGTTIRLGATPAYSALYVHCQTNLVARWRLLFADSFQFSGDRAVLIPNTPPLANPAALQHMAAMALTYHRDKAVA